MRGGRNAGPKPEVLPPSPAARGEEALGEEALGEEALGDDTRLAGVKLLLFGPLSPRPSAHSTASAAAAASRAAAAAARAAAEGGGRVGGLSSTRGRPLKGWGERSPPPPINSSAMGECGRAAARAAATRAARREVAVAAAATAGNTGAGGADAADRLLPFGPAELLLLLVPSLLLFGTGLDNAVGALSGALTGGAVRTPTTSSRRC